MLARTTTIRWLLGAVPLLVTAAVADDALRPGAHETLTVEVSPRRGDTDTTFRIQTRDRFDVDLTGTVPQGKRVFFRAKKNDVKVVKLGGDGTPVRTIVEGAVSMTFRGERRVRVSYFDLERLGPNGPGAENLGPGKYRYTADVELTYGWDENGDGQIRDDEFDTLMTADAEAQFTVEDSECDAGGPCCELSLTVDVTTVRAGDMVRLAGFLVHAGEQPVYQSLVIQLETADGLELVRGVSEPYDILPGEQLLAHESVELPPWLLPGTYRIVVTMDRMVQGALTRTRDLIVVE